MSLYFTTDTFRFLAYSIPAGQMWLSDFVPGPGDAALPIVFPPRIPRQVYIARAWVRCSSPVVTGSAIDLSIDHGSITYKTGQPLIHQVGMDQRRDEQLAIAFGTNENVQNFWPPKLLDRDASDRLWFECDTSGPQTGFALFAIDFLVPAPMQPVVLPVDPIVPWVTRAGVIFDGWTFGWDNYTIAVAVDASAITGNTGSQTRVVFDAPGGITSCYIGPRVAGTTQQASSLVQMTPCFDGRSFVCPQGIDASNGILVQAHVATGYVATRASQPGWHSCWKLGDDTGNLNGQGYSAGQNAVAVQMIQGI
jgi:hypothetical protein